MEVQAKLRSHFLTKKKRSGADEQKTKETNVA